jgi:hypothetical protein
MWSESQKKYYYSPKAIEARKRYWNSEKGKAARRRYMEKRKLRLKAMKTVQAVVENKPVADKKKEIKSKR